MKFKTMKGDQFEVTPEMIPHLRALAQLAIPGVSAGKISHLHVNRQKGESGGPLDGPITLQIVREVELSEQEVLDAIAAGQYPAVHGMVEE